MEISAKEINRQANRLMIQVDKYYNLANENIKVLENLNTITKSEDSNLSNSIMELCQSYITLRTLTKNYYSDLSDKMSKYASSTISNEISTTNSLMEIIEILRSVQDTIYSKV